ncbi:twin-arginine translocase TatA/TatE family subunit [Streptomyces sp. NPDC003374]
MFGLSELAVILIVVIAVLAAKRLPDLARSAGKSARILKAEARAVKDEDAHTESHTPPRVIRSETAAPDNSASSGSTQSSAPHTHTPGAGPSRPQNDDGGGITS